MAAIWATHQSHFRHQDEESANSTYLAKRYFYQAEHVNWIRTQHLPPIYSFIYLQWAELKKKCQNVKLSNRFFTVSVITLPSYNTFIHFSCRPTEHFQVPQCTVYMYASVRRCWEAELTWIIFRMYFLWPVSIKGESVLGGSTGTALNGRNLRSFTVYEETECDDDSTNKMTLGCKNLRLIGTQGPD